MRETIFAAQLAELAGPVGQGCRNSLISQIAEAAAIGIIEAPAAEPAPPKLVIGRRIKAERLLLRRELLPLAPYEFASTDEGMVDGTPQRLPAQGRVDAIQLGHEIACSTTEGNGIVVAASVGQSEIKIGRFADVFISPQMLHRTHIAASA